MPGKTDKAASTAHPRPVTEHAPERRLACRVLPPLPGLIPFLSLSHGSRRGLLSFALRAYCVHGLLRRPVVHNQGMARGWESKSVESQMESAESERESARRRAMTAGELARERERKSLELSRTRVLRELAEARNARHRQMLETALAHLDGKISELD